MSERSCYTSNGTPGYEVNPVEQGYNNDLPHIKWQDWTNGKSEGANGHIFIDAGGEK